MNSKVIARRITRTEIPYGGNRGSQRGGNPNGYHHYMSVFVLLRLTHFSLTRIPSLNLTSDSFSRGKPSYIRCAVEAPFTRRKSSISASSSLFVSCS